MVHLKRTDRRGWPNDRSWHECDLRAALTNVRSWESSGLDADVAFGPFMTPSSHSKHFTRLAYRP
jgi:hypothetical protein